jgi:hypothetical protein
MTRPRRQRAPSPEPTKAPPSRQDASPRAPDPFSVRVYLPGEPRPNESQPEPTGTVELTASVAETGPDSLGAWMVRMAGCCWGCGLRRLDETGKCGACGARKDAKP